MLSLILKHPIMYKTLLTEVQFIHGTLQKCFKYEKNILSSTLIVRTFLTKSIRPSDGLVHSSKKASFLKLNKLPQNLLIHHQKISKLDVNTNVQNNVILYKSENDKYFRIIQIFAFGQLFGWSVLARYTYSPAFFDIFTTHIKFKEYLKKYGLWAFMFTFSIFAGFTTFAFIYATCARNIKYIILNKGGKTLTLLTYHMWKRKSNIINLPVGMAKCVSHRTDRGLCIPVKITNKSFYYLIDKKGEFVNPKLFDYIMG